MNDIYIILKQIRGGTGLIIFFAILKDLLSYPI
jgi:hypothetical protein